jgi:hypothetical protein
MKTVFLLKGVMWKDHDLIRIFSTLEKAIKHGEKIKAKYWDLYVTEVSLDVDLSTKLVHRIKTSQVDTDSWP